MLTYIKLQRNNNNKQLTQRIQNQYNMSYKKYENIKKDTTFQSHNDTLHIRR